MIVTRHLRGTSDVVMAAGQVGGMLAFGLVMGPLAWTPLRGIDVALMALLGCVGMGALMCVNRSLKLAPASVVVPYQYTMIVWAVLFGYWGFGDVPKPNVIAGAAVIVAMQNYLATFGAWVTVIQGVIFVACVLLFREGIVGVIARAIRKPL